MKQDGGTRVVSYIRLCSLILAKTRGCHPRDVVSSILPRVANVEFVGIVATLTLNLQLWEFSSVG